MPFDAIPSSRSAALRSLLRVSTSLDLSNCHDRNYVRVRLSDQLGRAQDYIDTIGRAYIRRELTPAEFRDRADTTNRTIDDLLVAIREVSEWAA